MSNVYYGRYNDLFSSIKVGEQFFVKCLDSKEYSTIRSLSTYYGIRLKRKFSTKKFEDQMKITRIA